VRAINGTDFTLPQSFAWSAKKTVSLRENIYIGKKFSRDDHGVIERDLATTVVLAFSVESHVHFTHQAWLSGPNKVKLQRPGCLRSVIQR
jgi:hypothetical protein